MAGPDSVTSVRTSVYHTAAESDSSPANSASPIGFWTPAPPRLGTVREDDDDTPRASAFQRALSEKDVDASTTSAALLERYVGASTPAATPTMNTPRTRLQARLQASQDSQASSVTSTPVPTVSKTRAKQLLTEQTPSTTTTTSASPLVRKNMLLNVSPQSPTYSTQVKDVVEHVVRSLFRRGRTMEGHALIELYKQSFKDPGTAELLDALLRQRANERQKRDFVRYVEVVTRLGEEAEVPSQQEDDTVINHEQEQDDVEVNINEEEVAYLVPKGTVLPPSPKVVINVPVYVPRPQSTVPVPSKQNTETTHSSTMIEDTLAPVTRPVASESPPKEDLTPTSSTISMPEQLSQASKSPEPKEALSKHPSDTESQTVALNVSTKYAPSAKMPASMLKKSKAKTRSFAPALSITRFGMDVARKRRRKKNRQRMFNAANGPVFSKPFKMP
jgi:hypothetical protein